MATAIRQKRSTVQPVSISKPESIHVLLEHYLMYLQGAGRVAPKTRENRSSTLGQFVLEAVPDIQRLTLTDIDGYLYGLSTRLKPSTVNVYKQSIRLFLEYCQTRKGVKLQFDYTMIRRSRERPPKVQTFSRAEVSRVIQTCKHEMDALMIAVLYETGLRIGELSELQVDDIRGIEVQVRGKGERGRVVMMSEDLAKALRSHLINRGIYRGYVFQPLQQHSNHPNYKFGTPGMRERVQKAFKAAGVTMHPHQLRHSFALNWLRSGGDIRFLQKLLGHDSLETTQRYLELTDNHLKEEYQRRSKTVLPMV